MAWSDRNKWAMAVRLFTCSALVAPTPVLGALAAHTLVDRAFCAALTAADAVVLVLSARYLWARRGAGRPAAPEAANRRELMTATVALVSCGLLGAVVALHTSTLAAVGLTGLLLAAGAVTFVAARRAKE